MIVLTNMAGLFIDLFQSMTYFVFKGLNFSFANVLLLSSRQGVPKRTLILVWRGIPSLFYRLRHGYVPKKDLDLFETSTRLYPISKPLVVL